MHLRPKDLLSRDQAKGSVKWGAGPESTPPKRPYVEARRSGFNLYTERQHPQAGKFSRVESGSAQRSNALV